MKIALITLSEEGARLALRLRAGLDGSRLFLPEDAAKPAGIEGAYRFDRVMELTAEIFPRYEGLVYLAPCGVAVRAIAGCLKDKHTDPAVVVVDAGGRFAVSLLSGHEGGANDLAVKVANILGAEPVITTTTEAVKNLIIGIGCRRGTASETVVRAVTEALRLAGEELSRVRFLASADIKSGEEGLREAARLLGVPVRFISSEEIRSAALPFDRSDFVKEKVNLPAVAEPAALLAGRRPRLILPKAVLFGVTVAVARESFLWSE